MPDNDGYPTEEELAMIKGWDLRDPKGLIDFVRDCWWQGKAGVTVTGKRVLKLELHTFGWSGNESIIEALQENIGFWFMWWRKSTRGGHYYFTIRLELAR